MVRPENRRKVPWFQLLENTVKYFDGKSPGQQTEVSLVHRVAKACKTDDEVQLRE